MVDNLLSGEYVVASWDKEALGVEEVFVEEQKMRVYPNPADRQVNLHWAKASDGMVLLYDMKGNLLKQEEYSGTDHVVLVVEGLASGSYIIKRIDKGGAAVESETIIIK